MVFVASRYSTIINNDKNINSIPKCWLSYGFKYVICSKSKITIFLMKRIAVLIESALKNIQQNVTKVNVDNILRKSASDGSKNLFSLTSSTNFLLFSVNTEGIKRKACKPPQMMKVQLAPCQNPETKKIINTFLIFFSLETRDPPIGIYK